KQIEQAQHHSHFDGAQGNRNAAFLHNQVPLLAKEQAAQVSADAVGNEDDNHQVAGNVPHKAEDKAAENRVGAHEKPSKNQQRWKRQSKAQQHSHGLASPKPPETVRPFAVAEEEGEHSKSRIEPGQQAAHYVLHQT